jgi:hypothetical protein
MEGKMGEEKRKEYSGNRMLTIASDQEKKLEDLKTRRTALFVNFVENPDDTPLALGIKKIDDEIAECQGFLYYVGHSKRVKKIA